MALTYTPSPDIGNSCPDFTLPSVDGKTYSLADFKGAKAFLVMFICNHCPYVQAVEDRLIQLNKDLSPKGAAIVGICSNDAFDYPEDAPSNLLKRWQEKEYGFPYLVDESQGVARAFGAVCTPDFFLYDGDQQLSYRGRLDDSWKDATAVTKNELKEAMEALLAQTAPPVEQFPAMGCSIKWKQ